MEGCWSVLWNMMGKLIIENCIFFMINNLQSEFRKNFVIFRFSFIVVYINIYLFW